MILTLHIIRFNVLKILGTGHYPVLYIIHVNVFTGFSMAQGVCKQQ
jgi:hypothetical protein